MRIAFVIQDMYRQGAQFVTAKLSKGFVDRGHDVDILVSDVDRQLSQSRRDLSPFFVPASVRLVRMTNTHATMNTAFIARYMRTAEPTAVIAMSGTYEYVVPVAALLARSSTVVINVEHSGGIGITKLSAKMVVRPNIVGGTIRWLYRLAGASRLDRVIAVSNGVRDALLKTRRHDGKLISVIYNPVVDTSFANQVSAPAGHPWLINKGMPVVVAAGAHVPIKAFDVLIRSMAYVMPLLPCRLIIFGEGTETALLVKLADELGIARHVSFPGFTHNLPACIARSDVFVVSSHAESFSIVLVEALACGTPVVATRCPSGPTEILKNGIHGLLVEPDNPRELGKAILQVLCGRGIRPSLQSWQPYALADIARMYEELIMQLAASRQSSNNYAPYMQ